MLSITYRSEKHEQLGQDLNEKYEHEVIRRVLHDGVQEVGYARVSHPLSPGCDENDQEHKNVYYVTARGSVECEARQNSG